MFDFSENCHFVFCVNNLTGAFIIMRIAVNAGDHNPGLRDTDDHHVWDLHADRLHLNILPDFA